MSTWDNYQEKVRTNIRVPADKELLTEKQWAKKTLLRKAMLVVKNYGVISLVKCLFCIYGLMKSDQ